MKRATNLGNSNFSIANPQKFLPLPEVALEADALGNLKGRDDARSICFPLFPACWQADRYSRRDR